MKASIIIVNYNNGNILTKCIESILKFEAENDIEIIIVDNNSADNSKTIIDELKNTYREIKTIFLVELKNYSYANNKGFDKSTGEYIVILNPDIVFIEPLLKKLTEKMKAMKEIGAICPLLIGDDLKFQRNYFQRYPSVLQFLLFYSMLGKIFYRFSGVMNRYLENQEIEQKSGELVYVEQIPCAFFFTSTEIFKEIGKMDSNFVLFFEDVDLSYRINKKYKLAVDKTLKVMHAGGASMTNPESWKLYGIFLLSMNYFFDKHYNRVRALTLKYFSVTNSILILILENIKKLINKSNDYRIKKHRFFLNEFKKHYLRRN